GIVLFHSTSGGTGSGLGTLILSKIQDEYSDRILTTNSIAPSPDLPVTNVEPYNFSLCMNSLIEYSGMTSLFTNDELLKLVSNKDSKIKKDNQSDYWKKTNPIIAGLTARIYSSMFYPSMMPNDLRKMSSNLIVSPRLHLLVPGGYPIPGVGAEDFISSSDISEIGFK
ncbi:MAG: hypothetical protein MHPSP_003765, partial [Paramarteilia canceri]